MLSIAVGLLLQVAPPPRQDNQALSCPSGYHGHQLQLDERGLPEVHVEAGKSQHWDSDENKWVWATKPPVVMDGLCHDDNTEQLQGDPARRILPVPDRKM